MPLATHTIKKNDSTDDLIAQLAPSSNDVGPAQPTTPVIRLTSKNARRPRKPMANCGKPKKGGAGSKTVWGQPGSENDGDYRVLDSGDPNYDSEDDARAPKFTLNDSQDYTSKIDHFLSECFKEYLNSGDVNEVVNEICEFFNNSDKPALVKNLFWRIPYSAINLGLDQHKPKKELISALLADLSLSGLIKQDDFVKGFQQILQELSDLKIDTPHAPEEVGIFMARAIADHCLPSSIITEDSKDNADIIAAKTKTRGLIANKNKLFKLHDVWGHGGGNQPVRLVVQEMQSLIKDFVGDGDKKIFQSAIKELDVPHFLHHLIYEMIFIGLEINKTETTTQLAKGAAELYDSGLVSEDQFKQGLVLVKQDLQDLKLDYPFVEGTIESFVETVDAQCELPEVIFNVFPSQGRKRFVSETDSNHK